VREKPQEKVEVEEEEWTAEEWVGRHQLDRGLGTVCTVCWVWVNHRRWKKKPVKKKKPVASNGSS
jgi:hypothetical protein